MRKNFIFAVILSAVLSTISVHAIDYSSPDVVKWVQQALNDAGYDCGTPDGIAGSRTANAISAYRKDMGLPDGTGIDQELYEFLKIHSGSDTDGLQEELKNKYGLVWFGDVKDDTTGRWRLAQYSSQDGFETFAKDYYYAFFDADDEIHAVINQAKKITYRVTVFLNSVHVDTLKYVDKEEQSAKTLFGGDLTASYSIDLITGKITEEDISDYLMDIGSTGTSSSPSSSSSSGDAIDSFISLAEPVFRDIYGDNMFIKKEDSNTVSIGVWADGLSDGVYYCLLGDAQNLAAYQAMKEGQQAAAKSFYDLLHDLDPNADLIYSVLNDADLSKALIIYYNGVCFYDCLEE